MPQAGPAASLRAVADRLGLRMHNINIYRIGGEIRIDVDLEPPKTLSLAGAHQNSEDLEQVLHQEFSNRATIAVELSKELTGTIKRTSWIQLI
jgi:divalent metal cation (Fe/Co/Zn/Cd) transporter